MIEIARVLYKVTKELEETWLPGKIASIYVRLENIDGCPYFSRDINEYTANDIKVRCSGSYNPIGKPGLTFNWHSSLAGLLQHILIFPIAIIDSAVLIDCLQ